MSKINQDNNELLSSFQDLAEIMDLSLEEVINKAIEIGMLNPDGTPSEFVLKEELIKAVSFQVQLLKEIQKQLIEQN